MKAKTFKTCSAVFQKKKDSQTVYFCEDSVSTE